jgi:hypothetical protein
MKSHIKNKSELVALRYCYLFLLYNFTIFLSVGCTRELWFQVLLLPFIRIIPLFSKLLESSNLLAKIFQSMLMVSIIFCYWLFSIHFTFNTQIINGFWFFYVFYGEILLTIIFHRYIFFSKMIFFEKYILILYRILKKYYIDILLIVASYMFVYYFLTGYGIYYWGTFFSNLWIKLRFYIYMYLIAIAIASVQYIIYGIFHIEHRVEE